MTQIQLNEALSDLKIPVAYGEFTESQTPPYLVFYRDMDESVKADNISYIGFEHIVMELYVKNRNLELEKQIKALLNENEIPFEVDEAYISEEKIRMIKYIFYVNKEE